MISHIRANGRLLAKTFAVILGSCVFCHWPVLAQTDGNGVPNQAQSERKAIKGHAVQKVSASGTLGYGPPGIYPGFQGFGLGYHLGYGYGGDALGVGAEGGYPFYGGPGYPHPAPRLRRFGGITPFCYYGGPGYATTEQPNFFGSFGPLAADERVVTVTAEPGGMVGGGDFGAFTGGVPNAEEQFARSTLRAAAGEASMRQRTPAVRPVPAGPPPDRGPGAASP